MVKKNPLKDKRIFVGFNSAGAVGIWQFSRILKRRGYQIDFYGISNQRFEMPVDFILVFSANKYLALFQRIKVFFRLFLKYNIWHFNYMEVFFFYPLNLLILKLWGKKIIITFRGAEVRHFIDSLPEKLYQSPNRQSWPELFYQLHQRSFWSKFKQYLRIRIFCHLADKIVLTGPFLASSVVKYDKIIPYARDLKVLEKYTYSKPKGNKIIVLHAPSHKLAKGTTVIIKAFKMLAKKYRHKAEFKILFNLSHQKLLEEMAKADILIDQLVVGWYGGQAVEAMAMGKIVVANIFPAYLNLTDFKYIPIWPASYWTLEKDLSRLIDVYPYVKEKYGNEAKVFCQKYHQAAKIAQKYLEVYRSVL